MGTVAHLGVALFSENMKEAVGKPVCDFQERFFLELFLQDNETKALKLLDEYKIEFADPYFGSFLNYLETSILFAKDANNYVLTKDSLTWISTWSNSTQNFSFRFLANYDLILGMDKNEAEIWLALQLQNFKCERSAILLPLVETGELEQLNKSLYVKRGKNQFIQSMNSNLYFLPDTITCTFHLLYDSKFPEESIANMFNNHSNQTEGLDLHIRQMLYGGKTQTYKMKLSDLQCFMGNDYETFTGIEKCTLDAVEFTVMYKSQWYNCYHILHIKTTHQHLFDKTAPLIAEFITFIPNHNIKDLYKGEIRDRFDLASDALYRFACDSSQFSVLAQNEFVNDTPSNKSDVSMQIVKIKRNEYILQGTNKTMNNKELSVYFKDNCPKAYKTLDKGFKLLKGGTACTIIGGVIATGGFVGMLCTVNTDMLSVYSSILFGGAVCMIVGDIVINSGKSKMNNAIYEYNNLCANKNKTTASLNLGITQSGGVGFKLKF